MSKANNPAARLHSLLEAARKVDSENASGAVVWSQILDADPNDETIASRFLQLIRLYKETETALQSHEAINRDLYLSQMHQIKSVLSFATLYRPWNQVKQSLTDTAMQALAFGADRLSGFPQYREAENLDELMGAINELLEAILQSELDHEMKSLLQRLVNEIRNAVIEYRIRGPIRLLEAAEVTAGGILIHWDRLETHGKTKEVSRFFGVWRMFIDSVTLSTGVQQLGPGAIEVIKGLLPW